MLNFLLIPSFSPFYSPVRLSERRTSLIHTRIAHTGVYYVRLVFVIPSRAHPCMLVGLRQK